MLALKSNSTPCGQHDDEQGDNALVQFQPLYQTEAIGADNIPNPEHSHIRGLSTASLC
jgi:hypothetical protein